MTIIVNIHEAKTQLSRLLERVQAGEQVVIAKAGTPIADLVPHRSTPVVFGLGTGLIDYSDDAFDVDPDINAMVDGRPDAPRHPSCGLGPAG